MLAALHTQELWAAVTANEREWETIVQGLAKELRKVSAEWEQTRLLAEHTLARAACMEHECQV